MRIDQKVKRKLEVRVQMCRSSDDSFRLSIEDEASGLLITEIKMNANAVADMISNRMSDPMPAEYYHNDNIGKKHECKRYLVDLMELSPDGSIFESYDKSDQIRDLKHVYDYSEEKNPGWKVDRNEFNSKRRTKGNYEVFLRRYVEE